MPLGPTVYFGLDDVVLRHDLPSKPPPMSVVQPHLVFDNFTSRLGQSFIPLNLHLLVLGERINNVLKHLFPPASPLGKRVLSFVNRNDKIHFRHFVWSDERHSAIKGNKCLSLYASYRIHQYVVIYVSDAANKNLPEGDAASSEKEKPVAAHDEKAAGRAAAVAKKNLKSIEGLNLNEVGPRSDFKIRL